MGHDEEVQYTSPVGKRAPIGQPVRSTKLDVLRLVACLLVLGRHGPLVFENQPFKVIAEIVKRFGWTGVDLFFVLSGFLVSGLLFHDYQKYGKPFVGRFLIRRGFKIYPGFYVLFLLCLIGLPGPVDIPEALHQVVEYPQSFIGQALLLQNYTYKYWAVSWPHLWSLGVEEHFYIGLSLVVFLLARYCRRDPFRGLVGIYAVLALACPCWRAAAAFPCYFGEHRSPFFPFESHLRVDALMFGVVLSYVYHFRPHLLEPVFRNKLICAALGLALLVPAMLVTDYSFFTVTIGMTLVYLGYGALLLACLGTKEWGEGRLGRVFAGCAWVGSYSYSIYLWHWFVATQQTPWYWAFRMAPGLGNAVFLVECLATGIVMGKLVEMPFLRLRDRLFPSRSVG